MNTPNTQPETGEGNALRVETVRQWKDRMEVEDRDLRERLLGFAQSIAKLDSAAVSNGLIPVETWKRIHARAQTFLKV